VSLILGTSASIIKVSLVILAGAAVLTGLNYGSGFLIPLVVAFMVANILEALIERLERLDLSSVVAVPLAILIVLFVLASFVFIVINQVDAFTSAWPRYLERLRTLFSTVMAGVGADFAQRIQTSLAGLDLASRLSLAIGSAGTVLLNLGLVMLYAGFLLVERGRVFQRLVALGSTEDQRADLANALIGVSNGIRQYLFVKTAVSLATGLTSYVILRALNLDFAETWAVIIFLLNYIPSIGSALGVIFPALLALVQFDTLTPFLIIAVFLALVQFTIGNVIEPMLMGRSLNLSPFVIIVSLTFWGSVWGITGAFLAVPMTSALVILCREINGCKWVAILLSNDDTAHCDQTKAC